MKTYQFESTLKCSACEDKVRKKLESEPLVKEVLVNLSVPQKTITVKAEQPLEEQELIVLINEAGFEARPVKSLFKRMFSFF